MRAVLSDRNHPILMNSTLLLFALPSGESLVSIGFASPQPFDCSLLEEIPLPVNHTIIQPPSLSSLLTAD